MKELKRHEEKCVQVQWPLIAVNGAKFDRIANYWPWEKAHCGASGQQILLDRSECLI